MTNDPLNQISEKQHVKEPGVQAAGLLARHWTSKEEGRVIPRLVVSRGVFDVCVIILLYFKIKLSNIYFF